MPFLVIGIHWSGSSGEDPAVMRSIGSHCIARCRLTSIVMYSTQLHMLSPYPLLSFVACTTKGGQ